MATHADAPTHAQHGTLRTCAYFFAAFIALATHGQATPHPVSISRSSFNPSHGETVTVIVSVPASSRISVAVLDRDGHLTQTLARNQSASGTFTATWNGRDADGLVVANEAYSFKIDVVSRAGSWSYFPAAKTPRTYTVQSNRYSRRNAALLYELPTPARVHAQAGSATFDETTKAYDGVVLKTLVNREPRPAGAIVESWNGLDESGAIYIPDLPHFVTAILATDLPENSVIAYGNSSRTFLDVADARQGASLLPSTKHHSHTHHHGLTALDDTSPSLTITPRNATWNEQQKAWVVDGDTLELSVRLDGRTATHIARQPGQIITFVDYTKHSEHAVRSGSQIISERIGIRANSGPTVVSINWQSDYGPLAANSVRVITAAALTATRPTSTNPRSGSR